MNDQKAHTPKMAANGRIMPVTIAPGTAYDFGIQFDPLHAGPLLLANGANIWLSLSYIPNNYILTTIVGNVVAPHS
jgi:hypothetical protein